VFCRRPGHTDMSDKQVATAPATGVFVRKLSGGVSIRDVWVLAAYSSWNVMAHGDAREGKWRGNWRMEWVASTLHTTSEHGVSSITTIDAHNSAASSRLNWRPRRFKWTRPFERRNLVSARVPSHFNRPLTFSYRIKIRLSLFALLGHQWQL
jgi:hypothetical protein